MLILSYMPDPDQPQANKRIKYLDELYKRKLLQIFINTNICRPTVYSMHVNTSVQRIRSFYLWFYTVFVFVEGFHLKHVYSRLPTITCEKEARKLISCFLREESFTIQHIIQAHLIAVWTAFSAFP